MLPGKRTSEGAIYVLQGPPPAGTPLVGGIAVSDDGAIYASNASSLPGFPTNTVAPSISGTPVVGQTLTCTPGTWTGTPTPTVTRQWRANGVNIPGATGITYVVELAYANQNIRCLETATNSVGTASAQSNFLTIFGAPVNTSAPTVTGNAEVGSVLTTGNGTWVSTPTATYVYAWFSDGVVIPGQTANTYTTLSGDIGKTITSRVTATNPAGSVQVNSQNGILVAALPANPPVNTVAPVISGNTPVGSVLTTTNGTWTGDAPITYTYTWRADGVSIPSANSQTYTTVAGDVGKSIVCRVTAANVAGTANATSNAIVVTVATFSPASLFASGEQGAWYDPSDLTTMFQDRAGTTPVTADGQTVGLILDKSKGLVLGAEKAPPTSSTAGWGEINATLTSDGESLTITATTTGEAYAAEWSSAVVGRTYKVTLTVVENFCSVTMGQNRVFASSPGNYTFYLTAVEPNPFLIGTSSSTIGAFTKVKNVSLKEVAGNHAFASADANRPLYKTSGGLHWLQFDGVDDIFETSSVPWVSNKASIFAGYLKNNTTNGVIANTSLDGLTFIAGKWQADIGFWEGTNIGGCYAGSSTQWRGNTTTTVPTTKSTGQWLYDLSGGTGAEQGKVKLNNTALAWSGSPTVVENANFSSSKIYIMGSLAPVATNGNLYQLVMTNDVLTTQEASDLEAFVNGKTGAY